jgi:hypothetical protein
VFKTLLISFSLKSLLVFNIVSLVVGPIVLGLLFAIRLVLNNNRTPPPLPPKPRTPSATAGNASGSARVSTANGANGHSGQEGFFAKIRNSRATSVVIGVWKQLSFWIALTLAAVLQGLVIWGYVSLNPFVSCLLFQRASN